MYVYIWNSHCTIHTKFLFIFPIYIYLFLRLFCRLSDTYKWERAEKEAFFGSHSDWTDLKWVFSFSLFLLLLIVVVDDKIQTAHSHIQSKQKKNTSHHNTLRSLFHYALLSDWVLLFEFYSAISFNLFSE